MTANDDGRMRSLHDLVERHRATLAAAGVDSPQHDAIALARHVLGLSTAGIRTAPLPDDQARARLAELVERRAAREPLQLLIGATWFRYLRLECAPGVFVPRPETEIVAGLAVEAARLASGPPVVVEPCTGTGAIALAVVSEVPHAEVVATDVHPTAVGLARRNLAHLLEGRADVAGPAAGATCRILEGDLLDPVPGDLRGRVDVLVSNPPYLPRQDRDGLPPEVAEHDPDRALFAGDDGLEIVDRLLDAATTWLRPGGTLVVEIDERRGADVRRRAEERGLVEATVERDLTGADRALVARRPGPVEDARAVPSEPRT